MDITRAANTRMRITNFFSTTMAPVHVQCALKCSHSTADDADAQYTKCRTGRIGKQYYARKTRTSYSTLESNSSTKLDKVIPSINARKFDPKAKVTLVSFWLSTYQVSKKNLHDKGVRNPS